jgi:hypothetical protein
MPNWAAVYAATEARGPRCDRCGHWTFRPEYTRMPKFIARLCPDCLPLSREALVIKPLVLCQVFRSDLKRYPADQPIQWGT